MLHSSLFDKTVQLAIDDRLLVLNSAADAFVPLAAQRIPVGELALAEDNIAALRKAQKALQGDGYKTSRARHIPFHEYTLHEAPATMHVALMNILYQPGNAWMQYGLQLAAYALKPGGRLYVQGAKDRGILSLAKHMQTLFGNVETLEISKGERVICSYVSPDIRKDAREDAINRVPTLFGGEAGRGDAAVIGGVGGARDRCCAGFGLRSGFHRGVYRAPCHKGAGDDG